MMMTYRLKNLPSCTKLAENYSLGNFQNNSNIFINLNCSYILSIIIKF